MRGNKGFSKWTSAILCQKSVADQGFPRREVPKQNFGAKFYYFGKGFDENCMKIKRIVPRRGTCVSSAPCP